METNFDNIYHLCALSHNNVVVCGSAGDRYRLVRYSLQKGADLCSAGLDDIPQGMTSFTVDGIHLVAVSYG